MGTQTAQGTTDRQTAIRWMLRDLQALEHMLAENMFETGITRIGAEQEMFLVDGSWQPAPGAVPVLAAIADGHFTTEAPVTRAGDRCHAAVADLFEHLALLEARRDLRIGAQRLTLSPSTTEPCARAAPYTSPLIGAARRGTSATSARAA